MIKVTQQMFDDFPVFDGFKTCPTGDYSEIKKIGDQCLFDAGSVFGDSCSFGVDCGFGAGCIFGEWCVFDGGCSFGSGCHFGKCCSFAERYNSNENVDIEYF